MRRELLSSRMGTEARKLSNEFGMKWVEEILVRESSGLCDEFERNWELARWTAQILSEMCAFDLTAEIDDKMSRKMGAFVCELAVRYDRGTDSSPRWYAAPVAVDLRQFSGSGNEVVGKVIAHAETAIIKGLSELNAKAFLDLYARPDPPEASSACGACNSHMGLSGGTPEGGSCGS